MRLVGFLFCLLVTQAEANCARPALAPPDSGLHSGSSLQGVWAKSDAQRLQFLSHLLNEESKAAGRWTLGWGGAYGLLTLAQLIVMPLFPQNEKPDWYWGAVSSAVGVAFAVVDPLEVLDAGPIFAKRAGDSLDEIQTCQLIIEGERLLRSGAEHEASGTRWYIHLANVAFNVGFGLILGFGYDRWTSGIINAAIGTAIGEATIFTEPTNLISGWTEYLRGTSRANAPLALSFIPVLIREGNNRHSLGLGFGAQF